MKKTKFIKIFLFILMFVGFLIFVPSTSRAWSDSQMLSGITIGLQNRSANSYQLVGQKNLYCIWHGGTLNSSVQNTYYARYKVTIEGNMAKIYGVSGGKFYKKATLTSDYNAKLSWLLNGYGSSYIKYYKTSYSGDYTTTQKALYYYFPTWLSGSRSKLLYNWLDSNEIL